MATTTASAPRAKAALLELMNADEILNAVSRDWGPPLPDALDHEHIWFGRGSQDNGPAVEANSEGRIGNQSRVERYSMWVTFSVARGGYDQQAIEERSYELAGALELLLKANPRLEGTTASPIALPFQALVGGMTQRGFPALEGGWASEVVLRLDCTAHLRA
jgi:hypothetical protein